MRVLRHHRAVLRSDLHIASIRASGIPSYLRYKTRGSYRSSMIMNVGAGRLAQPAPGPDLEVRRAAVDRLSCRCSDDVSIGQAKNRNSVFMSLEDGGAGEGGQVPDTGRAVLDR